MNEDITTAAEPSMTEIHYSEGTSEVYPFVRSSASTKNLMAVMLTALIVDAGFGIYRYGIHAAVLIAISVGTSVVTEAALSFLLKRGLTIRDYSAAVTGIITGLILPPSVPYYFAAIAAACAIASKCIFGGIGKNILNPSMTGKLVLILVFRAAMNDFSGGLYGKTTPLTEMVLGNSFELRDMLTGNCSACIGTGSAAVILILTAYLVFAGVMDILIPMYSAIGFVLVLILFGRHGWNPLYLGTQLCGGGFLFTAGFMATDLTTSPVTIRGKAIYGFLFGGVTAALRLIFGMTEDAVVFALLAVNILARPIDSVTMPRPFGWTIRNYVVTKQNAEKR